MKTPILRQLSIAMTPDGTIGSGKDLLFTNSADLNNFSLFTQHTVLIAGRKTAEQMVNMNVSFHRNRPIVVVTEDGVLPRTGGSDPKNIFYATSLVKALKLAEEISERLQLNGYTVIGGATVYEEFLDMLDKGKTQVNRAYMFVADIGERDILDPVKLSRTAEQIRLTVVNRQVDPMSGVSNADVGVYAQLSHGDVTAGEKIESRPVLTRGKNCRFEWITDANDFDVTSAYSNNEGRFKLKLVSGVAGLRISDISHWHERGGVNSIDIYMKNGQMIDARPATVAGMNWLKLLLNKIV